MSGAVISRCRVLAALVEDAAACSTAVPQNRVEGLSTLLLQPPHLGVPAATDAAAEWFEIGLLLAVLKRGRRAEQRRHHHSLLWSEELSGYPLDRIHLFGRSGCDLLPRRISKRRNGPCIAGGASARRLDLGDCNPTMVWKIDTRLADDEWTDPRRRRAQQPALCRDRQPRWRRP